MKAETDCIKSNLYISNIIRQHVGLICIVIYMLNKGNRFAIVCICVSIHLMDNSK